MKAIRIRWEKLGGHYHCRFFTAEAVNQTFANCGNLVFDEREWAEIRKRLEKAAIEFLPEEGPR